MADFWPFYQPFVGNFERGFRSLELLPEAETKERRQAQFRVLLWSLSITRSYVLFQIDRLGSFFNTGKLYHLKL
jgi:hypothetical protein